MGGGYLPVGKYYGMICFCKPWSDVQIKSVRQICLNNYGSLWLIMLIGP